MENLKISVEYSYETMMDRHLNVEDFQIEALQTAKSWLGNPFRYEVEAENALDHNSVELTLKKEGKIFKATIKSKITNTDNGYVFVADISIRP